MAAQLYQICGLITAVAALLYLRLRVCFLCRVKGGSMKPALRNGSIVLISVRRLKKGPPSKNDIVVCLFPGRGKTLFIKRVAGVPGDTVRREEGVTYINEVALDKGRGGPDYEPYMLGHDEYFLVGDNRGCSHDSRDWQRPGKNTVGPVDISMIRGVAVKTVYAAKDRRRRNKNNERSA